MPLRIVAPDTLESDEILELVKRSDAITMELWSIAEDLARAEPLSNVVALYIEALNDTIDVNEERIIAGLYARVPETVLVLLIIGSVLTLGMVGYGAGLTRRRSPLTAVVMIIVLGAVITLVVDLDRPQGGFLDVSQQPLLDVQQQVGPPSG